MSKLLSVDEALATIKGLQARARFEETQEILDLPDQYIQDWQAGVTLSAGQLVAYDGVKYLALQAVTTLASQLPSDTGMLAIYKPYTDETLKDWIYGEYVEVGWQRSYDGLIYTAIQDPNANIYSPDLVPAVWEVESTGENDEDSEL